ncbi:hypothetical protein GCM10010329_52720 [Streptomyces spiroverticillatus]|uniref:DUF3224 domain-containing protein n=1 Tax=Streptomyces finlayi TaxID=67296 RepID=A0A918X1Y8_9ACTN|nr:DUF3224 domain-containing protein [Streptomyces finlayi]GHA22795.1 hypothetical protein GCM10010329_52720 [Streptomyces spiroverticillatus]GHD04611.1 hypothetical protein GCM10010334_53660 [Streptomyces finlayi]
MTTTSTTTTTTTLTATGHFTYASWDEKNATDAGTSPRVSHASVVNTFTGGIEAADTTCEYICTYATETTGTFCGMEHFSGRLGGREGRFVVEERGYFGADGTVHCTFEVVPDSGTDGLTGLTGKGSFVAPHGEKSVPYTFEYTLPA